MKHQIVLLGVALSLAFGVVASAQEPAPQPNDSQGMAVENVIVTAPALRTERALDNFIIAHSKPTQWLGKIARWKNGICPLAVGLSPQLNLYISQRIIRVAMMTGAPLDKGETCRPNILVIATDQPQAFLDFMITKRPALLGAHYISQRKKIATMNLPVQAWYSTATEDFWGLISADLPSGELGYGVMSSSYVAGSSTGVLVGQGAHVSGSHLGDGLQSELSTAVILMDTQKIAGLQIGPLADYVTMLALSQGQSYDTCQDVPTINNLMAPNCAAELKPVALTDIDATYLRGLYKMDAGQSYRGQRSSIVFAMKKELGGY
jgi:hypothetical protein